MATNNNDKLSTAAILEGLRRLAETLKHLDDKTPTKPGHYEEIPYDVRTSYELMQQGANLVHATSTKYTLMGKISSDEANKVAQDLLKGCQLICTGCCIIFDHSYGCSRSTRIHTKRASRAVLSTVVQLVQAFEEADKNSSSAAASAIFEKDNNLGAQKCGAVWSSCDTFLKKKLPQGNRNSMRRDLFTWMMESNETMEEFQEMIDRGPASTNEGGGTTDDDKAKGESLSFEDFCQADDEQYTQKEIEIAKAAVALIKCSRGTINVALKSSDSAGKLVVVPVACAKDTATTSCSKEEKTKSSSILEWIGIIHDMARHVGEGMTDLGTLLYPTLSLDDIETQGNEQAKSIGNLLEKVLDVDIDLDEEATGLATKLRDAVQKRQTELREAISAAR